MNAYKWSTTAASNNSAVPDGAPDGWLGANVNEWGREVMARVREHISDAAYIDETYQLTTVGAKTITRNSATQFQINSCDATAHFTAGRRIRVVGSTTDYGFVTTSSFSTNTLVNVTMDSGDVPTSPTQALVHVDAQIRGAAYYKTGTGNSLDSDKVDGYHASDIFGPSIFADALVNGSMLVWQRGTSGSCPAATRTYHADRWWTNPAGAAVTCARTTTVPTGAISKYAKVITGATSVTTCELAGQRIESYLIPYIKTTINVSALVKNDTGAALVVTLLLGTPASADDFTTVTNRGTASLTSIASGASARLQQTFDVSAYTNIDNGLEVIFRSPSGRLAAGTQSVTITEIQIDRASTFSFFKLNPLPDELLRCERYYRKTFPYATAVAQASGTLAGALTAQMHTTDGSNELATVQWQFPVRMRSTPTITTYNPTDAASTWDEIGGSGTSTATVVNAGEMGAFIHTGNLSGSTSQYAIHATAESEL